LFSLHQASAQRGKCDHGYDPECERGLQSRIAAGYDPVESPIVPAGFLFQSRWFPSTGCRVKVAAVSGEETACGRRLVRPFFEKFEKKEAYVVKRSQVREFADS